MLSSMSMLFHVIPFLLKILSSQPRCLGSNGKEFLPMTFSGGTTLGQCACLYA